MYRKRPFATAGRERRPARAAVCRIPCLILCLADVKRVGQCRAPKCPAECVRRVRPGALSYDRSQRSAPLTRDLDGAAEICLRRGPGERYALAGTFLKGGAVGDDGLFQVLGVPPAPVGAVAPEAGQHAVGLGSADGGPGQGGPEGDGGDPERGGCGRAALLEHVAEVDGQRGVVNRVGPPLSGVRPRPHVSARGPDSRARGPHGPPIMIDKGHYQSQ